MKGVLGRNLKGFKTANNEKKHITHCDVSRQYFYHSNTIMVLKHVKAESAPELLVC
jgi:hypothetical protein